VNVSVAKQSFWGTLFPVRPVRRQPAPVVPLGFGRDLKPAPKGPTLEGAVGSRVFVYFNLIKKLWSVRSMETRRVLGYADTLVLRDGTFRVSEAGRQRVLESRRKNVHAGVVGELQAVHAAQVEPLKQAQGLTVEERISYNPYKAGVFVTAQGRKPVEKADWVVFDTQGCWQGKVADPAEPTPG